MSPQPVDAAVEFQVHYLGSSADLAAARRTLEARRVVSRARLTPGITAVVADATVPDDHPTVVAARELGIDVLTPAAAVDRLLRALPAPTGRTVPLPVRGTPVIGIAVLALVGVLALLGAVVALHDPAPTSQTTTTSVDRPGE